MPKYHGSRVTLPSKLFSSVGACGINESLDVKSIQQMVVNAGYQQATGRDLRVTGHCGQETIEAIRWYQRLLNMHPSGLVHPVDNAFMEALRNAAPGWRQKHHRGSLTVMEGQVTFDAEGVDYVTAVAPFRQHITPFFSRILHWPPVGLSGVTLGRGYDMGNRSTGEIFATLRRAGLEEYKASLCARAAGLKGKQAGEFVKVYGPFVGEITHQQQIRLFEIAYQEKLSYARGIYSRNASHVDDALSWEKLDKIIREVFMDTIYQGNQTAAQMVRIMAAGGSKSDIIKYLKSNHALSGDSRRTNLRIRSLEK